MFPATIRGQWRAGDAHTGYFVTRDNKGKPSVHPVYTHQSKNSLLRTLQQDGNELVGFFRQNCLIQISKDLDLGIDSFRLANMYAGQFEKMLRFI